MAKNQPNHHRVILRVIPRKGTKLASEKKMARWIRRHFTDGDYGQVIVTDVLNVTTAPQSLTSYFKGVKGVTVALIHMNRGNNGTFKAVSYFPDDRHTQGYQHVLRKGKRRTNRHGVPYCQQISL